MSQINIEEAEKRIVSQTLDTVKEKAQKHTSGEVFAIIAPFSTHPSNTAETDGARERMLKEIKKGAEALGCTVQAGSSGSVVSFKKN
jgi:hypothetical protein